MVSRCPDVQLMSIPEEDAQLASSSLPQPPNGSSSPPSLVAPQKLEKPVEDASEKEEKVEKEKEKEERADEDEEAVVPYEGDPDMPPLLPMEPPKQFKILRRRTSPSPSPESSLANLSLESSDPSFHDGSSRSTPNLERTLEER
jgi:hypothetical protein